MSKKEYHIDLGKGDIPGYVLLPGDPGRVPVIAEFLDTPRKVASKREFVTWTGQYKGVSIAVCSTGIGCPSAAIAVEELIRSGAHTFIRIGTAGSLSEEVEPGDLVISAGSIREDGTTRQYVPLSYPAVPDPRVVIALQDAASNAGYPFKSGITHCKDAFYSEFPGMVPAAATNENLWQCWREAGVLATSMESSAIFVISSIRGVRAGEVLNIIGSTFAHEPVSGSFDMSRAINTALDAIILLERK
jgi:uridine phosphorylase